MVSSTEDGNSASWIKTSQSVDGFDKSLENAFSSISLSSTLSGVGNRPPALSASSISSLEDAGHRTGEFLGIASGFAPLTPASTRSRDKNNGSTNLSYSSPNTEYQDNNNIASSPLFTMSHISLNQFFSAPLQSPPSFHQNGTQQRGSLTDFSSERCSGSSNSDPFFKEAAYDSLAVNNMRQDESYALGTHSYDQLDRKQNDFKNESLFCDNVKSYGGLSGLSHEKDGGRILPVNNHTETSLAHGQDRGNYDIIPGGTVLNACNKDIRPVDSDEGGNRVASVYDIPPNFFGDEGRISSTIRSNYSPLHNMGSVDEHEQFLGNRARASSLGYPVKTGGSFNHHKSQTRNAHFQEASFRQGFQDNSSLTCEGGDIDEPYKSNHAQQGFLIPAFDTLPRRSSSDETCVHHLNKPDYPVRCTPPQTPPPANIHHRMPSHRGALDQDYQRFKHAAIEKFQQVGSPREQVMPTDAGNNCHGNFQNQELEFNPIANGPNMPSEHSSNFNRINCNFNAQQTNRPRSYSSGTNMNEYVRSQSFQMQSPQFVAGFNENKKVSQRADGSIVQHSPDRNLFAPRVMHRSQQHNQEYDYNNIGGALEANVRQGLRPHFPPASIGFNEFSTDCNYVSGRLGRNCSQNSISQLVEISQRGGGGMAPFDNNMPFVRDLSASGVHMEGHNTYDVVHHKHRKEVAMNAATQHFASVDPLIHYQGTNNLPKARPKYVYNVKFKRTQRHFILGQRMQRDVQIGSYVKVEADRGEDLGIVISCTLSEKVISGTRLNCRHPVSSSIECDMNSTVKGSSSDNSLPSSGGSRDLKRVLRLATHDEILLLVVKKEEEEELLKICEEKIVQRGLPMDVVDAEYQFDRHKLTFFFEAEGRVDFRELVRDLFSIYKTRIWMQQLDKSAPGADGNRSVENLNRITNIDVLPTDCDSKEMK